MPKRTLPPGIGPHNGRELELMLQGDKPMALFAAEPGMDAEDVGEAVAHAASQKLLNSSMD
ncbi:MULTISPECIES: hypothetical protein [unclassified Mesorhizobium]|uniref:hypothetical protein n=1 Tax=unclassified Mesorhizobium TaxID=325217 RepID=UPI001FE0ECB6|nr:MULTISPECIES: hypothetical protein [unclassified Mesorhizobium]